MKRMGVVLGLGLVATLALAGCGGGGGSKSTPLPAKTALTLALPATKSFVFTWRDVSAATKSNGGATEYKLLEDEDGSSGYSPTPVATITAPATSYTLVVPLFRRINARYILQACNAAGCVDSAPVSVTGRLAATTGYFKASNAEQGDFFGYSVALSADGNTLAVGAPSESSSATGVNGNQADNSAIGSGAVYVFARSGSSWSQQAYVKASNTGPQDNFGRNIALSADGNTLAAGAAEDSNAIGLNGNQADDSAPGSGAVYLY